MDIQKLLRLTILRNHHCYLYPGFCPIVWISVDSPFEQLVAYSAPWTERCNFHSTPCWYNVLQCFLSCLPQKVIGNWAPHSFKILRIKIALMLSKSNLTFIWFNAYFGLYNFFITFAVNSFTGFHLFCWSWVSTSFINPLAPKSFFLLFSYFFSSVLRKNKYIVLRNAIFFNITLLVLKTKHWYHMVSIGIFKHYH